MSRKDYVRLAAAFAVAYGEVPPDSPAEHVLTSLLNDVMDILADDNEHFDRARFHKAATQEMP